MLKVGDSIPAFSLMSEAGQVSSASLSGQRYVLYFYPKDDTPGCTVEACNFRDNLARFNGAGLPIYGVSPDTLASHAKFTTKYGLNFPLLADPDHQLIEAVGAWVEKNRYGRKYMGVQRSTFVVGSDGRVEKVWEKVTPDGHAAEVLAYLQAPAEAPQGAVPAASRVAVSKKAVAKKPAAKKPAAKKPAAKKPAAKKPAAKSKPR